MGDLAIIITILAALAAGAVIGITAAALLVARELRRGFVLSSKIAASSPSSSAGTAHAYDHPGALRAAEIDALDSLEAHQAAVRTLHNGSSRPGASSPRVTPRAPCERCARARQAVLRAKRAIFGP